MTFMYTHTLKNPDTTSLNGEQALLVLHCLTGAYGLSRSPQKKLGTSRFGGTLPYGTTGHSKTGGSQLFVENMSRPSLTLSSKG